MLSSTQSRHAGKKFYSIIFVCLFVQLSVQAQFNICPTGSYNFGVAYACAVDDQVYWGSRRDFTGVIVTTDGGNTWTTSNFTDPKAFPVYCIHAFNADVAFVTASTIYKTTNRGTTWTAATGIFTNSASFPNTIHFFDQNNGVAMGDPVDGYFEIYTTTNAGANWVRVPSSNIPAPLAGEIGLVNEHNYSGNSYWFPTNSQRLFRSTDRGHTWTYSQIQAASGVFPSVAFRDELNGLALTVIGNSLVLCKTNDGGSTWIYSNLPNWILGAWNIAYIPGTQSTYTINIGGYSGTEIKNMIIVTMDDGQNWYKLDELGDNITNQGFGYHQWTSVNSGWGSIFLNNQGCIYHWPGYTGKHIWRAGNNLKFGSILFGEVGDTIEISIGNYGTLPTTVNGLNLSSTNFSLVNPPTIPLTLQPWDAVEVSISFTPQTRGLFNDSLVILSDAANYSSLSVTLTGKALQFTPPLPNFIYAAAESLYTLTPANLSPIPVGDLDGVNIQGLTINPLDSVLIGISNSVLFKIDPIVGGLLPIVTIPVGNLRAIAYSSSGTLFAGTKSGVLYRIDINTGEATQVGTSSGKSYSSFSFNSQDGKLYASVAPFVGALKDAIYTVDTLSGAVTLIGLTGDGKGTPSIAFNRDGTLYGLKGTGNEVNRLISINTINGSGTEIGTLGQSNLQAIIMTEIITGIDEDDNLILTSYELFQNYPNPFNPSSVISYQLPVGGDVTLKIYDVLGNEIATLVNEYKPAGKYEVEFSAASLPSGVYFYQLKAGSFVETKKMLLLK